MSTVSRSSWKQRAGLSRRGRVIDPDGKTVMGAQAYGLVARWGRVKTLDDGTFEVLGLEPGHPRRLIFTHRARTLTGSVTLTDADLKSDAALEIRLEPAGVVTGRLIDEDGQPLAGAKLSVWTFDLDGNNLPQGDSGAMWPNNATFTADADGRFRVNALVVGVESSLGIDPKTRSNVRLHTGKALRNLAVGPGEVRDLGDVTVKANPID